MTLSPPPASLVRGLLAAGGVVCIWSGFNIVSRIAGQSPLTPFDQVALRLAPAGLLMLPILFFRPRQLAWRQRLGLATVGGLAYTLCIYNGFARAPAAHAGILVNGGIPFLTALLAWGIMHRRLSRRMVSALCIVGCGLVIISVQGVSYRTAQTGWGDGLFLAAALAYAGFGLMLRHWQAPPLEAIASVNGLGTLLYLPIYLLCLPKGFATASVELVALQTAYQGFLVAGGASLLYAYAVRSIGPAKASLMLALVPGLTAILATIFLAEPLGAAIIAGVVLVSIGAVLGATTPQASGRSS